MASITKVNHLIRTCFATLFASVAAFIFCFPFVWMLMASGKSNAEIFRPLPLFPEQYSFQYFEELFAQPLFFKQFLNSCMVSGVQTIGVLCTTVMAGYVFCHYEFRAKKTLFLMAMMTIVIPVQVLLIPIFEWLNTLNLNDHLLSMILPGICSGLGLLFFTQSFRQIPKDLMDSARLEGASEIRVFMTVLPLMNNAVLTYGFLHFILCWQRHLMPMIMIHSEEKMTLTVALSMLSSRNLNIHYAVLMSGSLFLVIPVAMIYVIFQKNFKSALTDLMIR
jgi:multiple sugar transport system permease protein